MQLGQLGRIDGLNAQRHRLQVLVPLLGGHDHLIQRVGGLLLLRKGYGDAGEHSGGHRQAPKRPANRTRHQ